MVKESDFLTNIDQLSIETRYLSQNNQGDACKTNNHMLVLNGLLRMVTRGLEALYENYCHCSFMCGYCN